MINAQNLFDNLIVVVVLLVLGLMIYCKVTGKTIKEIIMDIRDISRDTGEEMYEAIPNSFEQIR